MSIPVCICLFHYVDKHFKNIRPSIMPLLKEFSLMLPGSRYLYKIYICVCGFSKRDLLFLTPIVVWHPGLVVSMEIKNHVPDFHSMSCLLF